MMSRVIVTSAVTGTARSLDLGDDRFRHDGKKQGRIHVRSCDTARQGTHHRAQTSHDKYRNCVHRHTHGYEICRLAASLEDQRGENATEHEHQHTVHQSTERVSYRTSSTSSMSSVSSMTVTILSVMIVFVMSVFVSVVVRFEAFYEFSFEILFERGKD